MEKYIWLGSEPVIIDGMDDIGKEFEKFKSDSRVFSNDDYWFFCAKSDLTDIKCDYPTLSDPEGDIIDWVVYSSKDYWINSMEEIKFNDLVTVDEFIETIAKKVENVTKSEIISLNIEDITEVTVKELIIKELQEVTNKLKTEIGV